MDIAPVQEQTPEVSNEMNIKMQLEIEKVSKMIASMNRKEKRNYCRKSKLDFNGFPKMTKEESEKRSIERGFKKGWRNAYK